MPWHGRLRRGACIFICVLYPSSFQFFNVPPVSPCPLCPRQSGRGRGEHLKEELLTETKWVHYIANCSTHAPCHQEPRRLATRSARRPQRTIRSCRSIADTIRLLVWCRRGGSTYGSRVGNARTSSDRPSHQRQRPPPRVFAGILTPRPSSVFARILSSRTSSAFVHILSSRFTRIDAVDDADAMPAV